MKLSNRKIAILCTDGFEEVELTSPKKALEREGAICHIVATSKDDRSTIRSWDETDWGTNFQVDTPLTEANPRIYDALLLPGGVLNPDHLRQNSKAIDFIQAFFEQGKPVAAICHAPQLLLEADVVAGRTLTSYPSIQTDLKNAGANWVNQEVVVDGNLTTSRSPEDLDAFNAAIIEQFEAASIAL